MTCVFLQNFVCSSARSRICVCIFSLALARFTFMPVLLSYVSCRGTLSSELLQSPISFTVWSAMAPRLLKCLMITVNQCIPPSLVLAFNDLITVYPSPLMHLWGNLFSLRLYDRGESVSSSSSNQVEEYTATVLLTGRLICSCMAEWFLEACVYSASRADPPSNGYQSPQSLLHKFGEDYYS